MECNGICSSSKKSKKSWNYRWSMQPRFYYFDTIRIVPTLSCQVFWEQQLQLGNVVSLAP